MNKLQDYKFFLSIGLSKIKLEAIDINDQIFFSKKSTIDNPSNIFKLDLLENFLSNYIFEIEKNLKNYVKDVHLIIDHKDFLFINLSTKYNLGKNKFNLNQLNSLLIELKNQFKNTIGDFDVIHMVINKFMVDGKIYPQINEFTDCDQVCLEIKFICLSRNLVKNLKNILSNYQIMVGDVTCYEYLKDFEDFSDRKSSIIANKALNGLNPNEIFFSNKTTKNVSFFEKFFSFFN